MPSPCIHAGSSTPLFKFKTKNSLSLLFVCENILFLLISYLKTKKNLQLKKHKLRKKMLIIYLRMISAAYEWK